MSDFKARVCAAGAGRKLHFGEDILHFGEDIYISAKIFYISAKIFL